MRLLLLAGALVVPSLCAAEGPVAELEADLGAGRFRECVRRADIPNAPARVSYVGGLCALRLNDRDNAESLLKLAQDGGFRPTASWRKPPDELLSDIAEYRKLAPEPAKLDGVPSSSMLVSFDAHSDWVDSAAAAAPEFVRIGRRVFGADPPFTRLFLFSDYDTFEKFYSVVFGPHRPHGTGVPGLAVMVEKNAAGRQGRLPVAVVLHELMHAWIQGYGRDVYDVHIKAPPWVDEGMADYVASMWATDMLALRRKQLAREVAKRPEPPDFADFQTAESFYHSEDSFFHYVLSLMLIERLIGPPEQGAAQLKKVLDGYAKGEDSEKAWHDVTGKNPSEEYAALCAELWHEN